VTGLAGNLGVAVSGLHDNWTAFFQTQGAGSQTRIISVEKGTGYAVIQAADEGKTLFLGHPLVADNPAVSLTVARSGDWKKWVVEIHNPTDKEITTTVHSNPAYQGFTFKETLTLAPGSSAIRTLGPAG
jgi:thiamine biosynthesis lipoprotein ApbE